MANLERKSFDKPEETRSINKGKDRGGETRRRNGDASTV